MRKLNRYKFSKPRTATSTGGPIARTFRMIQLDEGIQANLPRQVAKYGVKALARSEYSSPVPDYESFMTRAAPKYNQLSLLPAISKWLRKYVEKHNVLPFVVDGINLASCPGFTINPTGTSPLKANQLVKMTTDSPARKVSYPTVFSSIIDGRFVPWNDIGVNSSLTYVLDDEELIFEEEHGSVRMYQNVWNSKSQEECDSWTIYPDYSSNYEYAYGRRNSLNQTGPSAGPKNHNILHDFMILYLFTSGNYTANVRSKDIDSTISKHACSLLGEIFTQSYKLLNATFSQDKNSGVKMTIGNAFKILIRFLGQMNNSTFGAYPVFHDGTGLGERYYSIVAVDPTLPLKELSLITDPIVLEKKEDYRKYRNMCIKLQPLFADFITIDGVRYGLIPSETTSYGSRVHFALEVQDDLTALATINDTLDWNTISGETVFNDETGRYERLATFGEDGTIDVQLYGYVLTEHTSIDAGTESDRLVIDRVFVGDLDQRISELTTVKLSTPSNQSGEHVEYDRDGIFTYVAEWNAAGKPEDPVHFRVINDLDLHAPAGFTNNSLITTDWAPYKAGDVQIYTGNEYDASMCIRLSNSDGTKTPMHYSTPCSVVMPIFTIPHNTEKILRAVYRLGVSGFGGPQGTYCNGAALEDPKCFESPSGNTGVDYYTDGKSPWQKLMYESAYPLIQVVAYPTSVGDLTDAELDQYLIDKVFGISPSYSQAKRVISDVMDLGVDASEVTIDFPEFDCLNIDDDVTVAVRIRPPEGPFLIGNTRASKVSTDANRIPLYLEEIRVNFGRFEPGYFETAGEQTTVSEKLIGDASLDWSPELCCFVGNTDNPISIKKCIIRLNSTEDFESYSNMQFASSLCDCVNRNILKQFFARDIDVNTVAEILAYIQNPDVYGLPVQADVLRKLIISAKETRTLRTAQLINAINDSVDTTEVEEIKPSFFAKMSAVSNRQFAKWRSDNAEFFNQVAVDLSDTAVESLNEVQDAVACIKTTAEGSVFNYTEYARHKVVAIEDLIGVVLDESLQSALLTRDLCAADIIKLRDEQQQLLISLGQDQTDQAAALRDNIHAINTCLLSAIDTEVQNVVDVTQTTIGSTQEPFSVDYDLDSAIAFYAEKMKTTFIELDKDYKADHPELTDDECQVILDVNGQPQATKVDLHTLWRNVSCRDAMAGTLTGEPTIDSLIQSGIYYPELVSRYNALSDMVVEYETNNVPAPDFAIDQMNAIAQVIKTMKSQLTDEYVALAADVVNYQVEDAFDAIGDDEETLASDNSDVLITEQIESIKQSVLGVSGTIEGGIDALQGRASTILQESDKISSLVNDKVTSLVSVTADKAKTYYNMLADRARETKEGIQEITNVLSFSLQNMVDTVRNYAGDVKAFLGNMVGATSATASSYGWQNSSSFTPASNISLMTGVVNSGVCGAISAAFALVGSIITGSANKIRTAVMTVVKDGVSFKQKPSGLPTLALQACSSIASDDYFSLRYPSLYQKLRDGKLTGNNNVYCYSQIGPAIILWQDYQSVNDAGMLDHGIMTTLNPLLAPKDDTDRMSDWDFVTHMVDSIYHTRVFLNNFLEFLASKTDSEGKPLVDGYCTYPVDESYKHQLIKDILSKAKATSAAATWGLRSLIVGIGVGVGALLCCTGVGSVAGIAMVAGFTALGVAMTGPALDQSKIEHLTNDSAYANATITASDMASIWTGCVPDAFIDLANFFVDMMSNIKLSDVEYKHVDLAHDGRGDALDLSYEIPDSSLYREDQIGFVPLISAIGTPKFRYRLVTDTERLITATAGSIALAIPLAMMTKKLVTSTVAKANQRRAAKAAAQQWATPAPSKSDFKRQKTSDDGAPLFDDKGQPIIEFDDKAFTKKQKEYVSKQAKLGFQATKLANTSLGSTSTESQTSSPIKTIITNVTETADPETSMRTAVDKIKDRLG